MKDREQKADPARNTGTQEKTQELSLLLLFFFFYLFIHVSNLSMGEVLNPEKQMCWKSPKEQGKESD